MKNFFAVITAVALMSFSGDPVNHDFIVVVDASHGGKDPGVTNGGEIEKAITLNVAMHIQEMAMERGIIVRLTRSADQFLSLEQRVSASKDMQADLFISLHVNGISESESGIECFVSKENPKFEESKKIASLIAGEFNHGKELAVKELKFMNFFVLSKNQAPSVLVELGNMTNNNDLTFISTDANQKLLAEKILASILKYKE